jgi:hypothetical protein
LPAASRSDFDSLSGRSSVAHSYAGSSTKGSDKSFQLGLSLPSPVSTEREASSLNLTLRPPQLMLEFDGPWTPVAPSSPKRKLPWAFMDDMALSRTASAGTSNFSSSVSDSQHSSQSSKQLGRSAALAWRDAAGMVRDRKRSNLKTLTISGVPKEGHVTFTQSTLDLSEIKSGPSDSVPSLDDEAADLVASIGAASGPPPLPSGTDSTDRDPTGNTSVKDCTLLVSPRDEGVRTPQTKRSRFAAEAVFCSPSSGTGPLEPSRLDAEHELPAEKCEDLQIAQVCNWSFGNLDVVSLWLTKYLVQESVC